MAMARWWRRTARPPWNPSSVCTIRRPISPPVARQLYVAQRVRAIPDVGYTPVPLLADPAQAGPPVDMTFCALRGVAPIHLDYMINMGVRATLAVSLFGVDGGLWGMIVCHHAGTLTVPPDLRALADLVGQVTSVLLASLQSAEALADELSRERHLRAVAAALADTARPLTEALAAVTDDLLRAVAATGAVARIGGTPLTLGAAPATSAALIDRLLAVCGPTAEATDALDVLLPEAAALAPGIAGALVLKLPHGSNDAIVWFRPELAATVTWGGDPRHAVEQDPGTGRLSPRRSFAAWQETVRGRSAPWTDTDLAAAGEVRRIVGETFVRRAEAELARLRNLDPLTGLANRRLLQERLDAVDRAGAGRDRAATAPIYIDLDRFKDVNDSLGHDAGDALLIEVARRLTASIDDHTLVARIGGDEFAILCNDVDITQAERVAATVRAALEVPFKLAGRPYRATASIGVAHTLANDLAGGVLLQAADAAMYVAKRSGGNGAAHYAEPLRAEISRRFALEQDLRGALRHRDGGGLLLHYQPVIASRTGRLEGFEALARWQHPEAGLVPPVDFIPIAEAGGLIGELGEWVLDAALDEAAGWSARLAPRAPLPYVAVNVSPRQLSSGAFHSRVMAALATRDLPPQVLRIEVTEAASPTSPPGASWPACGRPACGCRSMILGPGIRHCPICAGCRRTWSSWTAASCQARSGWPIWPMTRPPTRHSWKPLLAWRTAPACRWWPRAWRPPRSWAPPRGSGRTAFRAISSPRRCRPRRSMRCWPRRAGRREPAG